MDQLELETMVASQLLRSPELIYSLTVDTQDLRSPEVREIIKAIKELHVTGLSISRPEIVRLCPSISGPQMSQIAISTTNTNNFAEHVEGIKDCIRKDKLGFLADIIRQAVNDGDSPDKVISRIELYISELDNSYENRNLSNTTDMLMTALEDLQTKMKSPGTPGVSTGYNMLDHYFGGFERSKLYYIGARPSDGKTALMLNMAVSQLKTETPFGIISIESTLKEIKARLLSIIGSVFAEDITRGTIRDSELKSLRSRIKPLISNPGLYFHDSHADIGEIEAQVARMVAKADVKTVFIDYVQLIEGGKFKSRHEEVAYVSRQLKAMALRLNVAVVALAQMRREVDGRKAGMGDFAESSSLEKDADVMIAIEHDDSEMAAKSKLVVLKARDGQRGDVNVRFNRAKLIFEELRPSS